MSENHPTRSHRQTLTAEFARAAAGFDRRTTGRFDDLGVLDFAEVGPGDAVLEVGAGTGNFLGLFAHAARLLVAVDLSPVMLGLARRSHPRLGLITGDGARLPLRSGSVELVTSAQTLHHVARPLEILKEMVRVMTPEGRLLIVDQVATERFEEAVVMNELEVVRDPSHAASRPPSALRTVVKAAGLDIADERIVEVDERFSEWMLAGEFPPERIDAVQAFIGRWGDATGMGWRHDGREWRFTRRRMMLLAQRPGPS